MAFGAPWTFILIGLFSMLNMAYSFNLMLRGVIFQKLCVVGGDIIPLIPFVCAFYAFESPLFYSQYNHDGNVMVISSTMGIHQTNPLGRALFCLNSP
jgi:hypothetical protein